MSRHHAPAAWRPLLIALGAALCLPLAVRGEDAAPPDGPALYRERCLECHGKEGRGDGPKAKRLKFSPRDFAHASFKCRCTASGELPTDADLGRSIREGLARTPMLAHADLSDAEVRALVAVVRSFSPRFEAEPPAPCLEIPAAPPSSEPSVAAGRQLYRILQCWKCHGKTGDGDGPSAEHLEDEWGERIRPGRVNADRLKCGAEPQDLFRTMRTGLNGTPMPSYGEALLFDAESVAVAPTVEQVFGAEAAAELRAYLEVQPKRQDLAQMPAAARGQLVDSRTWAIVHYLISLRSPGP